MLTFILSIFSIILNQPPIGKYVSNVYPYNIKVNIPSKTEGIIYSPENKEYIIKYHKNKFILDQNLQQIADKHQCFIKEVNFCKKKQELLVIIDGKLYFEAKFVRIF